MHCANISPQCCINFVSPLLMNGYMSTVQSLSQHAFWHVTQALLIFSFNKLGTTCYCFVSKWLLCKKPTETVTPTQHHLSPTFHYLHLSWVFFIMTYAHLKFFIPIMLTARDMTMLSHFPIRFLLLLWHRHIFALRIIAVLANHNSVLRKYIIST